MYEHVIQLDVDRHDRLSVCRFMRVLVLFLDSTPSV